MKESRVYDSNLQSQYNKSKLLQGINCNSPFLTPLSIHAGLVAQRSLPSRSLTTERHVVNSREAELTELEIDPKHEASG